MLGISSVLHTVRAALTKREKPETTNVTVIRTRAESVSARFKISVPDDAGAYSMFNVTGYPVPTQKKLLSIPKRGLVLVLDQSGLNRDAVQEEIRRYNDGISPTARILPPTILRPSLLNHIVARVKRGDFTRLSFSGRSASRGASPAPKVS